MTTVQLVLLFSVTACLIAQVNRYTGTRRIAEKLAAWAARCRTPTTLCAKRDVKMSGHHLALAAVPSSSLQVR